MATLYPEKMQVIRDRTIAKVMWGEHENLTIEFLQEQGLSGEEVGEMMDIAKAEKAKVFRRRAISKLVAYLIGLIIFAAIPWFYYGRPELLDSLRGKMVCVISIVAWTACLALFVQALIGMLKGKNEGAALTE